MSDRGSGETINCMIADVQVGRIVNVALCLLLAGSAAQAQSLFPANKAHDVNPDVQLKITFSQQPTIGKSGKVHVYETANDRLVDALDMRVESATEWWPNLKFSSGHPQNLSRELPGRGFKRCPPRKLISMMKSARDRPGNNSEITGCDRHPVCHRRCTSAGMARFAA